MKLIDERLLERFRQKSICELCGEWVRSGLDPHHLLTKGGGRVDVRFNLAALCRRCHQEVHYNVEAKEDLWDIVCRREDMTEDEIKEKVWMIRRQPQSL